MGFYVTVKDNPDLRYRTTAFTKGAVHSDDVVLSVRAGRGWGEYPLRGDGSDVYFDPR